MNRESVLKLLCLIVLFSILAVAQPVAEELRREIATVQSYIPTMPLSQVLGETSTATSAAQMPSSYPVVKVVDGDTIKVDLDGKIETIRIIGINTPEVVDPRKSVECFGREASEHAKTLLNNEVVTLESDPSQGDRDKYQRLLRYVFLKDGTDFGREMIRSGFAYEYLYSTPYEYHLQYVAAQLDAQNNKRGLWADDACPKH